MFLCFDTNRDCGYIGATLEQAFKNYSDDTGDSDLNEVEFYPLGQVIQVEQKLVPVVVEKKVK